MMTGLNDVWNSRGDLKYEHSQQTISCVAMDGRRLLGQPVYCNTHKLD